MNPRGLRTATVLSALALAGGLTITPASANPAPAPPAPASALTCSEEQHPHSNKDGGHGWGTGSGGQTIIRTGPHARCSQKDEVPNGQRLNWHCWTRNDVGNKWTYLGIHGTNTYGWVWDGNLTGGGSDGAANRC
jgi:hypothetical protein